MSVPRSSPSSPSSSIVAAKAMESVPAGASPRAAARADSAATAKSTGPFRLLGSLLLFPFWLLWILLKGTAIIIALPFGGWRRLFKSAKSEEEDPGVVEKKLKNLSSEQQTIQTRMNKRATLWKSVSRYILMYSAIAEVLMVLVAMTFLRPTPPMPADEEDDIYLPELWLETLQHWVTFLGPLLLVPTFSALLYTTASRIIRTRDSKDQQLLDKLEEQRKGHLEALKKKTGFYSTLELLQKYDKEVAAATLQAAKGNQAGARGAGSQHGPHQGRQTGLQAGRQQSGQGMGPQGQRQMGWAGASGVGPGGGLGPGNKGMVGAGGAVNGEPQQRVGRATISSTGWPTPAGSPPSGRRSHHAAQSLPGSPSRSEARAQSFEYPMMPGADVSRDVMMSAEGDHGDGVPLAAGEKESTVAAATTGSATGTGAASGAGGPGPSPGGVGGATLRRRTGAGKSLRRTSSLLDGAVSALAGDILKDTDPSSPGAEGAELEGAQDSLAFGQSPKVGLQPQLRHRHGKGPQQGQREEDASLASAQGLPGGGEAGGRRAGEVPSDAAGVPGEEEDEDFGPGFRAAAAFGEVLHRTWSKRAGGMAQKKGWNRDSLIGWLAGMLVGEDPRQCYALICKQCCAHNGLARPEDFPYLSYVCPQCHFFNKAEGQRPERQQSQTNLKAEESASTSASRGTNTGTGTRTGAGAGAPKAGQGRQQQGQEQGEGRVGKGKAEAKEGAPLHFSSSAGVVEERAHGAEPEAGGVHPEGEGLEAEGELETPGLEGTITDFLDSFLAEGLDSDDLLEGEGFGDEGEDDLGQEVAREVAAAAPAKGLTKQRLAAVLKSLEDS